MEEDMRDLVEKVLETMSVQPAANIIDRVFLAIEHNQKWKAEYELLVSSHANAQSVHVRIDRYGR